MTDESRSVRRRTVLRAAAGGAASLAGLGASGTAAASSFVPGQCVRLTIDLTAYEEACPNRDRSHELSAGTEGTVWDTCTTDDGTEMIMFQYSSSRTDQPWASAEFFEHC